MTIYIAYKNGNTIGGFFSEKAAKEALLHSAIEEGFDADEAEHVIEIYGNVGGYWCYEAMEINEALT